MSFERKEGSKDTNIDTRTTYQKLKGVFESTNYIFDTPTLILVVLATIYLLFVSTTYGQSSNALEIRFADQISRIIPFLMFGLIFFLIAKMARRKPEGEKEEFRIENFGEDDIYIIVPTIAVGFLALAIIHTSISKITALSIEDSNYLMAYVAIAICEELAFSMIFQIVFELLFKSWIVGLFTRAFGFMAFHFYVYGNNPELMYLTFLSGLIFAMMLKISKRLSANIIVHALVNALSSGFLFTAPVASIIFNILK